MSNHAAFIIRLIAPIACLALAAAAAAGDNTPQPSETISITTTAPASSGKAIPIAVNEGCEFAITLEANHTTGYQWRLGNQPDEKIVKSVSNVYNEPHTNLLGAGGTETWTFQAAGKGSTQIVLEYVRPWEKGTAPIKTQTFNVAVQ